MNGDLILVISYHSVSLVKARANVHALVMYPQSSISRVLDGGAFVV